MAPAALGLIGLGGTTNSQQKEFTKILDALDLNHKKITMIGQGKKFEIWGNNTWESKVSKWRTEETDESEDTVLGDIRI